MLGLNVYQIANIVSARLHDRIDISATQEDVNNMALEIASDIIKIDMESKKKKKKKSTGRVNGYIAFSVHEHKRMRAETDLKWTKLMVSDIRTKISERWKLLNDIEKKSWKKVGEDMTRENRNKLITAGTIDSEAITMLISDIRIDDDDDDDAVDDDDDDAVDDAVVEPLIDFSTLHVIDLREQCINNGLSSKGVKATLVNRLTEHSKMD